MKRKFKDFKEIIAIIQGLKFITTFKKGSPFGRKEKSWIKKIVDTMGETIRLDKTYVEYEGSEFEDAFIRDEGWKMLIGKVNKQLSMPNGKRDDHLEAEIAECWLVVAVNYLYSILWLYGYDDEFIDIEVDLDSSLKVGYLEDKRTKWER